MNFTALMFTLLVGLSMLIGSAIAVLFKENKQIVSFSIGTAFSVMIFLLLLDLLPEMFEYFSSGDQTFLTLIIFAVFALLGGSVIKLLDHFIPHHHGDHCHEDHEEHEEENHLLHIGLITLIAITLHNVLEGMAIYGIFTTSIKSGMLFGTSIILHNIPLGMAVTTALYKSNESVKKTFWLVMLMSLSSFLGGVLMFPISTSIYGVIILQILLAFTMGMIIYLIFFEFLYMVIERIKERAMLLGLLVGIIIALIGIL